MWRDPGPNGELPNNWRAAFLKKPAWTLDETTGQLYLHSFLKEQPDLNWNEPEVVKAMHQTLRFWLDRGVDGFRADVVHNIGKDPSLPDAEERLAKIPHCALNDEEITHDHLRGIRKVLEEYDGDRVIIHLRVADDDKGRIIGRNGRCANAMRSLLHVASVRSGVRATLSIED